MATDNNSQNFDVNAWIKLYKDDPEAFEAQRKEWIENTINAAPSDQLRNRLRGLQFEIDTTIKTKGKSPYTACVELSKKMFKQLSVLQDALRGQLPEVNTEKPAKVISINRSNDLGETEVKAD